MSYDRTDERTGILNINTVGDAMVAVVTQGSETRIIVKKTGVGRQPRGILGELGRGLERHFVVVAPLLHIPVLARLR